MIDLLIFSMDRACQLDLLLRSIKKHADIFNISIIMKFSQSSYGFGYDKVIKKYPQYYWTQETDSDFEKLTKYAFSTFRSDFVSLSTDDCVFYKTVDKNLLKNILPTQNNQVASLRLGYNTIRQDIHRGTKQPPLNIHVNHTDWLSWPINRYHPHENYGYPFGLDLHIFRKSLLKPIIDGMNFTSTNQIESQLTTNFYHKVDEIRCFTQSVAVNIPINTVTGVTRAGEEHGMSKEKLNKKYLDGYQISLEEIEKYDFKGCHAEIPFLLKKEE